MSNTIAAGVRMRAWRIIHGYQLSELSEVLGITMNHICAIQSGRRKPGRALASRIKDLMGIKIEDWDA